MKKKEQEKTVKGASGFSSHFFRLFFSVSFSLLFFGKRNFFFPLKSRPVRVVAEVLVHGRFLEENSEISKRKTRFFSFKMRRSMNFQMRRKQKTAVFTVRHRKCRVSSACSFFWVCVLFAVRFFFSFLFFLRRHRDFFVSLMNAQKKKTGNFSFPHRRIDFVSVRVPFPVSVTLKKTR